MLNRSASSIRDPFRILSSTLPCNKLRHLAIYTKNCVILASVALSQYTCVTDDDKHMDRQGIISVSVKTEADLIWIDKSGSVVTPELVPSVVIPRNSDLTQHCLSTDRLLQFRDVSAIISHVCFKRVARCDKSGRISTCNEVIQSHLVWSARCLTNVSCTTLNYLLESHSFIFVK